MVYTSSWRTLASSSTASKRQESLVFVFVLRHRSFKAAINQSERRILRIRRQPISVITPLRLRQPQSGSVVEPTSALEVDSTQFVRSHRLYAVVALLCGQSRHFKADPLPSQSALSSSRLCACADFEADPAKSQSAPVTPLRLRRTLI